MYLVNSGKSYDEFDWTVEYTALITTSEEQLRDAVDYYWEQIPEQIEGQTAVVIIQKHDYVNDEELQGWIETGVHLEVVAKGLAEVMAWVQEVRGGYPDWEQMS